MKKKPKPKDLRKEALKHVKEEQVQNAIVRWLTLHRFNFAINPTRAQYSAKGKKFKRFDGTPGAPDIIVAVNGFYIGLELKRPVGGVQSQPQKDFQFNLEQTGGGYYQLVTCIDDIGWLHEFRFKTLEFHGYVQEFRKKLILREFGVKKEG